MYNLEIKEFTTQREYDEFMVELNKQTAILFEQAFNKYLGYCENDAQRTIFSDWWKGTPVSVDEYASRFSKEDNYAAGGIILEACSNGFG